MDFNKEYEQFLKDAESNNKQFKLIIDELDSSNYSYTGMKLFDFSPLYSNNKVKIYVPEKRKNLKKKLF